METGNSLCRALIVDGNRPYSHTNKARICSQGRLIASRGSSINFFRVGRTARNSGRVCAILELSYFFPSVRRVLLFLGRGL